LIGCVPLHVPDPAVSVCPCWAVPDTVGDEATAGGASTARVGREVARPEPAAFLAVTVTRRVVPTSRLDGV
jgi:hypothetical protein